MTYTPTQWQSGDRVVATPFGEPTFATIVKNIDATCSPLTDMWLVRDEGGHEFGISGKGISARTANKAG